MRIELGADFKNVLKFTCVAILAYYALLAITGRFTGTLVRDSGLSPHFATAIITWAPLLAWALMLFLLGYVVGRSVSRSVISNAVYAGALAATAFTAQYVIDTLSLIRELRLPITPWLVANSVFLILLQVFLQTGITLLGALVSQRLQR